MVSISIMLAKSATLGLKVFWNKCFDAIIFVNNITSKISSNDSSYAVDVAMSPKFGNSSISMREVVITSICKYLARKINYLRGAFTSSQITKDWH